MSPGPLVQFHFALPPPAWPDKPENVEAPIDTQACLTKGPGRYSEVGAWINWLDWHPRGQRSPKCCIAFELVISLGMSMRVFVLHRSQTMSMADAGCQDFTLWRKSAAMS